MKCSRKEKPKERGNLSLLALLTERRATAELGSLIPLERKGRKEITIDLS